MGIRTATLLALLGSAFWTLCQLARTFRIEALLEFTHSDFAGYLHLGAQISYLLFFLILFVNQTEAAG